MRPPRLLALALVLASGPTFALAGDDLALFNGHDLTGWVAEGMTEFREGEETRPVWTVEDGKIVCNGRGFGFLRYDAQEFGDFALSLEYRMEAKGNTGVGVRTCPFDLARSRATRPSFYSYEIQLVDDAGQPPSTHSTGSLYRYVAPTSNPTRPAGEWNTLEVECVGPQIRITLNGETILDIDQTTIEEIRDKPLSGYVCLQNHGRLAEFRNVRIREIETAPEE